MGMNVASLVAKRHTTTIDFEDGDKLTVTYRPYTIAERENFIERARNDGSGGDVTATKHLADLLISWDLTIGPDDPTPYPTDYESLSKLTGEFVGEVLQGIMGASRPNQK
jgi:hypothetical protein